MRFWGKLTDSSSLQPLKVFDDICKTESGISIRFNAEHFVYLQLIIPQYFISNKSGIWSLSLIVHSKG